MTIMTSASDLQRLEAFVRRSDRNGFVTANLPTFADSARTPTRIRLVPSPATVIMYYTTSFRLNLKGLNTTTYASYGKRPHSFAHPSPRELVISQTGTSCNACLLELILGIRLKLIVIQLYYPCLLF